jgi:hypothetical protein
MDYYALFIVVKEKAMYYNNQPQQGAWAPQFQQYPQQVQPRVDTFKNVNVTNPMTEKDLELLRPQKETFNINPTPLEQARAKCPHKNATEMLVDRLSPESTIVRCRQCGAEFDVTMKTTEEVTDAVAIITDMLNQAKLYAVNFAPDFFTEYMMMIPLLEKLPKLYDMAKKNFTEVVKSTDPTGTAAPMQNHGYNPLGMNAYNDILNGNYGARYGVYAGQPMVYPNQPGIYQQPQQPVDYTQVGAGAGFYQQPPVQQPMVQQPYPQQGYAYNQGYVQQPPVAYQQPPQVNPLDVNGGYAAQPAAQPQMSFAAPSVPAPVQQPTAQPAQPTQPVATNVTETVVTV